MIQFVSTIESSASNPRHSHLEFVGTVLPIRHPWWDTHLPPSDWNCACSVRPTNKEVTPVPGELFIAPVFKNNPGKTAEFVNLNEHPYIKGVCPYFSTCLRRKGKDEPNSSLNDADKQTPPIIPMCGACELAKMYIENKKRILENKKKFEELKNDPNYINVHFNEKTGGLMATHIKHNFDSKKGYYEVNVQKYGYNSGRAVIFEDEPGNIRGQRYTEGLWDDMLFEIAGAETATQNNIRNALKHCAKKRETQIAVIYFPNDNFNLQKFHNALRSYRGLKKLEDSQFVEFNKIIIVLFNGKVMAIK